MINRYQNEILSKQIKRYRGFVIEELIKELSMTEKEEVDKLIDTVLGIIALIGFFCRVVLIL